MANRRSVNLRDLVRTPTAGTFYAKRQLERPWSRDVEQVT